MNDAPVLERGRFNRRHAVIAAAVAGLPLALGATKTSAQEATSAATAPAAGEAMWVKFNLNTATEEQFRTIPGVGDRMVKEFLEYRPYASIAEFRQELGKYVDEGMVAGYEQYLFVPVDPNAADATTLQQLPGVSEETATALTDSRTYADSAAFLTELSKHVSPEQATLAAAFIATS